MRKLLHFLVRCLFRFRAFNAEVLKTPGPVLVIPFNWVFSHLIASVLPRDAFVARYLLLFALWAVAALTVLLLVPRIAALLDRKSQTRR